MGSAIAYLLLSTTFALSHYCHGDNLKSLFKVESEIIKHDRSDLFFSCPKIDMTNEHLFLRRNLKSSKIDIAYWLLPTTFALSHYCHGDNLKSLFKIEFEIIKHDKSDFAFMIGSIVWINCLHKVSGCSSKRVRKFSRFVYIILPS